jgi:hypothetical protein
MYFSWPYDDGLKVIGKLHHTVGDGNYEFTHLIPG